LRCALRLAGISRQRQQWLMRFAAKRQQT